MTTRQKAAVGLVAVALAALVVDVVVTRRQVTAAISATPDPQ